ncbi:hypothetical protein SAMN03159358_0633 [Paenibacillus sp. NFR01]|nr:hypothetical protein SAMN03159358_0633 [Paenibacillus sp. NFR01]
MEVRTFLCVSHMSYTVPEHPLSVKAYSISMEPFTLARCSA